VVIGGPHAYLYPQETAALDGVDFVIMGEGDFSMLALCDQIDQPARWHEVLGPTFVRDGDVVQTPSSALMDDLDSLPLPARHLTDVSRYGSALARRQPVTTMFTSRAAWTWVGTSGRGSTR
jgi:radical SAM superfamily enzyme YgiQ (UPF0313 family)